MEKNKSKKLSKEKNNKKNSIKKVDKKIETDNKDINKDTKKTLKSKKQGHIKIHYSFTFRVVLHLIICLLFLFVACILFYKSFQITNEEQYHFVENGNVSYNVCLKKNSFYSDKCLSGGMGYVANLIDNIPVSFHYDVLMENQNIGLDVSYEIKADLVIGNADTSAKYYEKSYSLQKLTSDDIKIIDNKIVIDKDINIDYNTYNKIANNFKSSYGVDIVSYLDIYFIAYHKTDDIVDINSSSILGMKIPLSEKTVEIKPNVTSLANDKTGIINKTRFEFKNGMYFCLSLVALYFFIYNFIKLFRLLFNKNYRKTKYDKYISKLLREFDRLIVETVSMPNLNDYNVIKITSFEELLDVRDNLELPIMHYVVTKHIKDNFYVLKDNNLYLCILKDVDFK